MGKIEDLKFAKLDLDRENRTGFPEVVFCQGKNEEHLVQICKTLLEKMAKFLERALRWNRQKYFEMNWEKR